MDGREIGYFYNSKVTYFIGTMVGITLTEM